MRIVILVAARYRQYQLIFDNNLLCRVLGAKRTIIIGLSFEMMQLLWYGFGSQSWMMWAAGILASLASITYPAISAFVSIHSNPDQQGRTVFDYVYIPG